jgi:hypothetical protein
MNDTPCCQKAASFVGILGAFLVVGLLIFVMKQAITSPQLNEARVRERKTALGEIRDANAKALNNYEIVDPNTNSVRLTVERAMELTIEEYKNPTAARTSLVARAERANVPPPKPPEQPSKYE